MKVLLCLLLLMPVLGLAQKNEVEKKQQAYTFETIVQTGLLAGGSAEAFTLQTVNGFRYQKWFAGIGTGFDYYMQRSIPLFVDVRYDFSAKRKTFFLYGDAGINFAWTKRKEQLNIIDQTPGLYTDAGIGLKIKTKRQDAFVVSAGYSHKQLKETQQSFGWRGWPSESPTTNYYYQYRYNRIAIKLGFVF